MKRITPIFCLFYFIGLASIIAQPTATLAPGHSWVKVGTSQFVSAPTSSTPSVSMGQNTSFSLPDTDPASCMSSCTGSCDAPSQFIGKKVFGMSVHSASACEQRAHNLNHWNNDFPDAAVVNGATTGTVHLPTSARLDIIQGTPGTGGGGSTNHGYVIGGWGFPNESNFTVNVNWAISWATPAFSGISGNSGPQTKTSVFQGYDPGGTNTSSLIEWSQGFGTSFGASYLIPVSSLPQAGGTFEMVYSGVSSISVLRNWGNADGEAVHSPGMEGRASHTVDYDIWTVQAPLPVRLVQFDATKNLRSAVISFVTTAESNMKAYEIQRSNDTKHWVTIETLQPKNQQSTTQKYNYTDVNLYENELYYRLKMMENDGKSSYSRTIALENKQKGNSINVYPNPVKNTAQLAFNIEAEQENITLEIYNIQGQIVKQKLISINGGVQNISLDIEELATGFYTAKFRFENTQEVIVKKLQKI